MTTSRSFPLPGVTCSESLIDAARTTGLHLYFALLPLELRAKIDSFISTNAWRQSGVLRHAHSLDSTYPCVRGIRAMLADGSEVVLLHAKDQSSTRLQETVVISPTGRMTATRITGARARIFNPSKGDPVLVAWGDSAVTVCSVFNVQIASKGKKYSPLPNLNATGDWIANGRKLLRLPLLDRVLRIPEEACEGEDHGDWVVFGDESKEKLAMSVPRDGVFGAEGWDLATGQRMWRQGGIDWQFAPHLGLALACPKSTFTLTYLYSINDGSHIATLPTVKEAIVSPTSIICESGLGALLWCPDQPKQTEEWIFHSFSEVLLRSTLGDGVVLASTDTISAEFFSISALRCDCAPLSYQFALARTKALVSRMLSLVVFYSYAAFYIARLGENYRVCMLPLFPIDSPASYIPTAIPRVIYSSEYSLPFKLLQAANNQQGPVVQINGEVWAMGREDPQQDSS